MNDLISRQAAIDALQKEINKGIPPFDDVMGSIRCGVRLARNIIEDLPFVQPQKGKWIEYDDGWANVYYECSVCKEPFVLIDGTPADNLYNFCPNCGADMRGDSDE